MRVAFKAMKLLKRPYRWQVVTFIFGLLTLSVSSCASKRDETHFLTGVIAKFQVTNAVCPSWSPDGRKFVFIQALGGDGGTTGYLELLEVPAGNVTQLGKERWIYDSCPIWSPDSTQIAIGRDYQIWLVDIKSGNTKFLTTGIGAIWSPTGDTLAVFRDPKSGGSNDGYTIVFVTLSGEELKTIPEDTVSSQRPAALPTSTRHDTQPDSGVKSFYPAGYFAGADWSPDGQRLVYSLVFFNRKYGDIYTINIDGSGFHELTSTSYNEQPAWSPDATKIAYVYSPDEFGDDLMIASAVGDCRLRLTEGGHIQSPSWSLDGHQIAVLDAASSTIIILDVEKFLTDKHFDPKQCKQ